MLVGLLFVGCWQQRWYLWDVGIGGMLAFVRYWHLGAVGWLRPLPTTFQQTSSSGLDLPSYESIGKATNYLAIRMGDGGIPNEFVQTANFTL